MSKMSDYLEDSLVNHILKNITFASPSNTYLALFTSDAGLEENLRPAWNEVAGGSYSRVQLTPAMWKDPANGATENNTEVIFPTATADWGTITHTAIMDSATGGNVLLWTALNVDKTITTGDSARFLENDLDVSFA